MKKVKQKLIEAREAAKEAVNSKVNPLILKGATLEQRTESQNHYSFVATNYQSITESYNSLYQSWNPLLQIDTSPRKLEVIVELQNITDKLQDLGTVAQQIYAVCNRILERHNTGASPEHAKNDCNQWLNEQKQLGENSFYPKYYALKNDIESSSLKCKLFVPVLTPQVPEQPDVELAAQEQAPEHDQTVAAAETTVTTDVEQPRAATPTLLFSNMALAPIAGEQPEQEQTQEVYTTANLEVTDPGLRM